MAEAKQKPKVENVDIALKDLRDKIGSLQRLGASRLKGLAAFRMIRFMKQVTKELAELEKDRIEIARQYSNGVMKDGHYVIPPNDQKEFDAEVEKIHDDTVKLEFIKIDVEDFIENRLNVNDYAELDFLFIDPDGEPEAEKKEEQAGKETVQ